MQTVDLQFRTTVAWNQLDDRYFYNLPEEWAGAYVQIFAMSFDEDTALDDVHGVQFFVFGDMNTIVDVNSGDAANHILSLTPCVVHVPEQTFLCPHTLCLITTRIIKWTIYYAILSMHDYTFTNCYVGMGKPDQIVPNCDMEIPDCFVRPYIQPCAEMFVILKKDIYVDMIVRHLSNPETIEETEYEIVDSRTLKFAPANFNCLIFKIDVEYIIYVY